MLCRIPELAVDDGKSPEMVIIGWVKRRRRGRMRNTWVYVVDIFDVACDYDRRHGWKDTSDDVIIRNGCERWARCNNGAKGIEAESRYDTEDFAYERFRVGREEDSAMSICNQARFISQSLSIEPLTTSTVMWRQIPRGSDLSEDTNTGSPDCSPLDQSQYLILHLCSIPILKIWEAR